MSLSFTRAYRKLALDLISGASPSQPGAWTPTDPEPEPDLGSSAKSWIRAECKIRS